MKPKILLIVVLVSALAACVWLFLDILGTIEVIRERKQIISCGPPSSYKKADGNIGVMQICLRNDGLVTWQRVLND